MPIHRPSLVLGLGALLSFVGACATDHPDLGPGDSLGIEDLYAEPSEPLGSELGGTVIGEQAAAPGVSVRSGGGGTGGGNAPIGAVCGNGILEAPELCDGANLGGSSCMLQGFAGGTLLCDPQSCTFDDSMCMNGAGGMGGSGP